MEPQEPQYNPQTNQPQQSPAQANATAQSPATAPAGTAPTPSAADLTPTAYSEKQKKALAVTALVLAILSVVLGVAWFIAAPLAIIAIILAIISLAKKRGGKGMSIAGLVIGAISLLFLVPLWIIVSLVTLDELQQRAESYQTQSIISE